MNDKIKLKEKLEITNTELKKIKKLNIENITDWNDEISKIFSNKYKKIEKDIDNIISEIEELNQLL